jgi:tripartite-type tricarboxylate transporter receptor subunit TctC
MASAKRIAAAPDVPTLTEGGMPVVGGTWVGMLAPAGTPRAIVDALARAAGAAVRKPEINDRFVQLGIDPVGSNSPEFTAFLRAEVAKWAKVIQDANVKIEN